MNMWKNLKLFYTTYISVDLAQQEIFCVKVGKGGIKSEIELFSLQMMFKQFFPETFNICWMNEYP